ncbi:PREDICTED: sodium-independent sulfate anion transporter-like isoform X2 [Dinoponera quadriceps]|uniref:Sodium-independent sulfate anion transporter-like isoform X2 n=1 Tax=Dinoponera quadriceps TaxID=609295 RepID=A0A6P3XCN4_DINQU|nr:PREDICTED: sodium-independent sulfate anion transporter-like isoform X2 [Dinoponera quadriceps]
MMSVAAKASEVEECSRPTKRKCPSAMAKHMPILGWLPQYSRMKAMSDLIAGITLGLTMIPQSIAYAALAGLTAQYGLYSCFVGGFLYIVFGTIKEVSIGPSSLMALITLQYTRDMPIEFVVLLCFLAGCVELLMGVLNLGFLVDFISIPVTSGFISATSMIIIIAQLQGLLGLKYRSVNIIDNLYKLCKNIGNIRLPDLALGICSILFLLLFKKLKDIDCPCGGDKRSTSKNSVMKKILWYFSIGRNALIVCITTVIAYRLETTGSATFRLSAMGANVNATQEMLTLGLCNIVGSFVSSMPSTGAFTRSAVSNASGVQTPMAGLYSGTMALLALNYLTPYFYYIPRATLAAVLITAVIFMIDLKIIKLLWKGRKMDAVAAIGTFLSCLFISVEIGLLLGIFFNLVFFIRPSARPTVQVINRKTDLGNKYVMLELDTCLYYPAVASFIDKVMTIVRNEGSDVSLIVNCERFVDIDYTSIKGIEMLSTRLNHKINRFWLLNLNSDIVRRINILADNKYIRLIGNEENIKDVLHENDALLSNGEFENSIDVGMKKMVEIKYSSHEDFLNLNPQPENSEIIAEDMTAMLPTKSRIQ